MTEISQDPIGDALNELRGIGLLIERLEIGPPPRGKVWRVEVEGQKKGKKAGWYIAYEIRLDSGAAMIVGSYGIWVGDQNQKHRLATRSLDLNGEEKVRLRQQQKKLREDADLAEEAHAKDVQARAKDIWDKLPRLIAGAAGYLKKKGVTSYGLAQGRDGVMVVPLRNSAGLLTQLQFIDAEGVKRFLTGPGKLGSYHLIGTIVDEKPLVFAEGYATGASIHQATGWPVVVCFDAANLVEVGTRLRPIFRRNRFIFAADDDHEKKRNAGREVVMTAAGRCKAQAVFPRFNDPSGRTDFNDVHAEQGLEAVRKQLEDAVTPSLPAEQTDGEVLLDKEWRRALVWDGNSLDPTVHNVVTVLEHHPAWAGVFAYDQFTKRFVKRKAAPWGGDAGWLRDQDEYELEAWFGSPKTFQSNISSGVIRRAIYTVGERYAFHPLKDYFAQLKWDGEPRIARFFADYCGLDQTETLAGFAHNFFTAAVARIYEPGCKADLMLVLEGDQGKKKSTMIEVLAGKGFYADLGQSPSDKDFFQAIQGVWLVELSEMASFAKAETSHIKRAISVAVDRFRRSYGHNVEDFPRECLFFGTANDSEWQRDHTGGRRYMPVWVAECDIDGVKLVRDQLWAEAVHRYRQGEPWWVLPPGAQAAQEDRYLDDVWTDRIAQWLAGRKATDVLPAIARRNRVTVSQILTGAIEMELKKQDRSAQTRVGNIMKRLGWAIERKQKRVGTARLRFYMRPKDDGKPEEEA